MYFCRSLWIIMRCWWSWSCWDWSWIRRSSSSSWWCADHLKLKQVLKWITPSSMCRVRAYILRAGLRYLFSTCLLYTIGLSIVLFSNFFSILVSVCLWNLFRVFTRFCVSAKTIRIFALENCWWVLRDFQVKLEFTMLNVMLRLCRFSVVRWFDRC